tara:strand:- start:758 stop:1129 length:372 start_codon:yes stop_codon:yes gene_type:complete
MKTKFILFIIFCLFLFPKLSFSEDLKLENKINKNLRCLICQGQSIYDSQSDFAESMKIVVKQKINSGMNEEEIYSFFKTQYGEWILYDPQFNTKSFVLWLLPIIVFLAGGIIILSKFGVLKKR